MKINTKKLLKRRNERKQNDRKLLIKKAGEKMNSNPIDIIKSKCYPFAKGIVFEIAPNGELKYHSGSSVVLRDTVITSKEALDAVMTLPAINDVAVEELTAKNGSKYYRFEVKFKHPNKVKKFISFENDPSILIELLKRAQRKDIISGAFKKINSIKFTIEF
jgi:hypothetical protein